MTKPLHKSSIFSFITYGIVLTAWVAYIIMVFLAPSNSGPYHLGLTQVNLLRISFAIPILIIWLLAARAAIGFHRYAQLVKGASEGSGFRSITHGLCWMLAYLISISLLGRIAPLFAHSGLIYPAVFVKNHMPVYILVAASVHLYWGSTRLLATSPPRPSKRTTWVWLAYLVFAAIFTAMFFSNPTNPETLSDGIPTYAVSHSILLFTLILPSLIAWALAIIASVNYASYAAATKGVIYKAALRYLVSGIYASVFFALLLELLILNAARLQNLGLMSLLLVIYGLILAYGLGAALMARGARRLTLIEVVE